MPTGRGCQRFSSPESQTSPTLHTASSPAPAQNSQRARIASRWGESADNTWIDPKAQRRAYFDIAECRLRIDRYLEVDAWIDNTATAPVPLGIIGEAATAVAQRFGTVATADNVRWSIPGIGRASGVAYIDVIVERGRVISFDARGFADPATFDQLRARLTALRGKPLRNDEPTRQIWRGKPPVHLDVERDGSFLLSISNWTHDPP